MFFLLERMQFDNPIDCSTAIISDFVFHLDHMNILLPINIYNISFGIIFAPDSKT